MRSEDTTLDLLTIGETMALISPRSGGEFRLDAGASLSAGGAESNVAIAAAGLGVRTAWYSRVGAGALGELVVESVHRWSVDTSLVQVDRDRPTGLMVKTPGVDGSRVEYYRRDSAASAMGPQDLEGLPRPRIVHMSGITAALSASCRELLTLVLDRALSPARVSFDVNYRPSLWRSREEAAAVLRELAARADIVFVGRDEAEALWDTRTAGQVRDVFPDVETLVVKDGPVEAVEFTGGSLIRVPAHAIEVVEPVGAGDAFAAGWLTALLNGDDAATRLRSGHRAAEAVLKSPTDQSEFVRRSVR